MIILQLLSIVGTVLGFILLTLSVASGLYYLSEVVEEHSELTKRILIRTIYSVIGLLITLWIFDRFPFGLTILSILSHLVYRQNLTNFPYIYFTSASFLASCGLVVLNHYLWFRYFSSPDFLPPAHRYDSYNQQKSHPSAPSFSQVASFFGICIWLVPFILFVSLSAADNVLPSTSSATETSAESSTNERKRPARLAQVAIKKVQDLATELFRVTGWRDQYSLGDAY